MNPKYVIFFLFLLTACGKPNSETPSNAPLFTSLNSEQTNINFSNQLDYNEAFNIYTYRNFYNGGGVGMGDFNKDGLIDIYFTANMKPNKLYLNRGDFKFEEVTDLTGVAGERGWSTGVSVADVNGDGWMDIYVCNSGDLAGDNKQNELFINDGPPEDWDHSKPLPDNLLTFTESAEAYGLADQGYSTHAAFFDYDKDGDLDVYLLNNSYQAIGSFNLKKNMRPVRDEVGGDKLFRNDGETFTDVSEEAGIYGSVIGFGLGVTVGDIDQDGWQDIYVSNDFFERDYIYMNNGDGSFREELTEQMRSISGASMGADMADINNDGYADVFVTEMLPGKNERIKTKTTFENWDKYQYNLSTGYYHQFTRNMLHLNNTDGTFSEIGRLAGVEATDWSWGALIMDMDNDGFKDIFVANGIYQDLTDQDYINFISNEQTLKSMVKNRKVDYKALIDSIPIEPIPNYAFQNDGTNGLTFSDKAKDWGLATPSHSNGSAYADLDNDGDLDLVVNNVNREVFVYRNEVDKTTQNNYLKIILNGIDKNPYAVGTKLKVISGDQNFYLEQVPVRGFQSTVDHRPNFGLGAIQKIDSLIITWPNDKVTILTNIEVNQTLTIDQTKADNPSDKKLAAERSRLTSVFSEIKDHPSLNYEHRENEYVDFDVNRLVYHMLSTDGPKIIKGDVNGDDLDDFYIGGAKDAAGQLFVQTDNGDFITKSAAVFEEDKASEDTNGTFFDADNDGDQDLYVTSGGSEFSSSSSALKDRLYFNDGQGNFERSPQVLPAGKYETSSCVRAADFDLDGDQDLFVGIRLRPTLYGVPANGYLLENDGSGNFKNISKSIAPELEEVGMITDVQWSDIDQDKDLDLVIVGDWQPITIFENKEGTFTKSTIPNSSGWWNTIQRADLDNDGDEDFVIGNHGLNSRFCATPDEPVTMYVNDFDKNRTVEQIVSCYEEGVAYPMVLRHDLVMQLPSLKKKYLKYHNYKNETVQDIFTPEQLENAVIDKVTNLETSIMINEGNGSFSIKPLPIEAQLAPVYGILIEDINDDKNPDILLGGNLYGVKPEVGRYDASYGNCLLGDGKGNFEAISSKSTGFRLEGQIRDIASLKVGDKKLILVARNNDRIQIFERK